MTVYRNEGQWDTSNVVFDGTTIMEYSKTNKRKGMDYIDYGLGILGAATFLEYDLDTPFDLAAVYGALAAGRELAGYEAKHRFYEIGSPSGLTDTANYIAERERHKAFYRGYLK